jgi:hypothetical protein
MIFSIFGTICIILLLLISVLIYFYTAPAKPPATAEPPATARTCYGGAYCDGTSADGTPVGTTVCGDKMNQFSCSLSNGNPTWVLLNKTCDDGMPHAC